MNRKKPPYRTWHFERLEYELSRHVSDIGISVRTANALETRGIFTVKDLLMQTKADIISIPNLGEKSYFEIMAALKKVGFEPG